MRVVFRVDASSVIGTGHVKRCHTLAVALKKRGAEIHFITRAHLGHMGDMLAYENFQVTLLPQPSDTGITGTGYDSWLGVTQEEDAAQTIIALGSKQSEWLVVDHYSLDRVWEARLRPHAQKLMVIDDLANRPHDCDLLLDQNFADGGQERYQGWVPSDCRLLLGPRYALLRPEYAEYRETIKPRTNTINRIMVYMGGSDHTNITGMVLAALSTEKLANIDVDVVIGSNFLHKDAVIAQTKARPRTLIYGSRPHLADLMAKADIAIGAGGATTWERLCMGLPSIVISIAENQNPACEALGASGLIRFLGNVSTVDFKCVKNATLEAIAEAGNFRAQRLRYQILVDGRGTNRVAEVLDPSPSTKLNLRRATSNDALTYYMWLNDSEQKSDLTFENPIHYKNHSEWLDQKLKDRESHLFVLEAGNLPAGQIQFKWRCDEAVVEFSLDALVRGREWEKQLIKLGIEALETSKPKMFSKQVRTEDYISGAPFIRMGLPGKAIDRLNEETTRFSIAVVSDQDSWINDFLPEMVHQWLKDGHRILWTHQLSSLKPADFCFYLSFSKIVPKNTRQLFKYNLVVHESDLPQGKGWSPITWQIIEGKQKIAVALIEAEDKVDSGVIYAKEWIDLQGNELIDEVRQAQAQATINLCKLFVNQYPNITSNGKIQKGAESFYAKRTPEDSRLKLGSSLADQFNLLRTVDNRRYPAFFEFLGCKYKIEIKKLSATPEAK
jgi:UDP-2,4-diacetamido-2,4,6-trideoxy-beta-L-altropyranose hydrolase